MSTAPAVAVAVDFLWLGMVVAISFLEAPLKFRAPGVTTAIGLGIGRLVFRAMNVAEAVFAVVLLLAVFVGAQPARVAVPVLVAAVALAVQLAAVRPVLNRRTRAVLAGDSAPRSRAHHGYIGLEVVKLLALVAGGVLVLAG